MGDIDGDRTDQYLPLSIVRARLMDRWTLEDIPFRTGGPARYVRVKETGGRLGFITPMTHNFCESCNRVRLTCTGTLYMCLGQNDAADLRAPLRASADDAPLMRAIDEAISRKPKGHDFVIDRRSRRPAVARHMSVTGGVIGAARRRPRWTAPAPKAEFPRRALPRPTFGQVASPGLHRRLAARPRVHRFLSGVPCET